MANRNYRLGRNDEPILTPAQRRQHELAWLLYITEGHAANVRHALTVNAFTLDRATLRLANAVLRNSEVSAKALRQELARL